MNKRNNKITNRNNKNNNQKRNNILINTLNTYLIGIFWGPFKNTNHSSDSSYK